MKYLLKKNKKDEGILCDKFTIDGFDYYIIDTAIGCKYGISKLNQVVEIKIGYDAALYKGIICSNNPTINLPKVVDEVEQLAHKYFAEERFNWEQGNPNGLKSPQSLVEHYNKTFTPLFQVGYNKSQETHPFSEQDMIKFLNFVEKMRYDDEGYTQFKTNEELLQLWKKQQSKIIYYD